MKTLLIYDFDGEDRREEFDDAKALSAKMKELQGNRLVRGYAVYDMVVKDQWTRPKEEPQTEE